MEDLKVVPIYLTLDMVADIGTKALDPKLFCRLRDLLCGYAGRLNAKGTSTGQQSGRPEIDDVSKPMVRGPALMWSNKISLLSGARNLCHMQSRNHIG